MHLIDYLLLAVILAGVILAVRHIRTGKSCTGLCESCGKNCRIHTEE